MREFAVHLHLIKGAVVFRFGAKAHDRVAVAPLVKAVGDNSALMADVVEGRVVKIDGVDIGGGGFRQLTVEFALGGILGGKGAAGFGAKADGVDVEVTIEDIVLTIIVAISKARCKL